MGTRHYIEIMQSVVYSYLDKGFSPDKRLHDIWYAVFLLRYWRQWILNHPKFTLRDNFITSNAYMYIEINAHSLLMSIIVLNRRNESERFVPWLYDSQSCERMFRALRSMTGTFSTVINFNMLGLLRRLHKLYIQEQLQSDTSKVEHGITFPRQERFGRRKDGSNSYHEFPLCEIVNPQTISGILEKALDKAHESLDELGMADDLKKNGEWQTPPLAENMKGMEIEKDSDNECEQKIHQQKNEIQQTCSDNAENGHEGKELNKGEKKQVDVPDEIEQENEKQDNKKEIIEESEDKENHHTSQFHHDKADNHTEDELMEDKNMLCGLNVIDDTVLKKAKSELRTKHKKHFEEIGIPLYVDKSEKLTNNCTTPKNSLFVDVEIGNEKVQIRKQTVVWLFQETE